MYGTQEYYDKTAHEWAQQGYSEEGGASCLHEFLRMLPKKGRVLDLCCGAGYDSRRIQAYGFEAIGIDFSAESLAIARQHNPNILFLHQNMLEDYSDIGHVDGILLSAGLVHIETDKLPLAFEQMAKVLPCNGLILLSIREGNGKLPEWSFREIDGQSYDRNFIAHTLQELEIAAAGQFTLLQELPSDMRVWKNYLFKKIV